LHVVHALLEREDLRAAVRHASAALVEQNEAAERSEPADERSVLRGLPGCLDVRHVARNPEQIERAIANDLIGDVNVIAPDVTGRRCRGHESFASTGQSIDP
jgi:hypothetical protein